MQRFLMPSNDAALRASLTAQFNQLTQGMTEATQISRVLLSLPGDDASLQIISSLARRWNAAHNPMRVLPAEMLARCFACMSFRSRISASHVSSAWRAIALAYPAVWSYIEFYGKLRNEPALLRMALSRTGQRAVDLRHVPEPDADSIVESCIGEHMHHFKSINWSSRQHIVPFHLPAPLLERVWAFGYDLEITSDFLGARAGRLHSLQLAAVSLPITCPALSTVADLNVHVPMLAELAASFGRLFHLCPSLRSLSLGRLELHHARLLPSGPVPRTLEAISLQSFRPDYDLVRHYTEWKSGCTLRKVLLELNVVPGHNFHIAGVISGAERVTFLLSDREERSFISAFSPGLTRSIEFEDTDDGGRRVADLFLRARDALAGVRELKISAEALAPFVELRVLHAMGQLACIWLFSTGTDEHKYDWTPLSHLAEAKTACPRLDLVIIVVETWEADDADVPPNAADARALLAALARMDAAALPDIQVEGFSEDAMQDVPMPDDPDLRIEFEM